MNWKGSEKKPWWPVSATVLAFAWRPWGKPRRFQLHTAGTRVVTWSVLSTVEMRWVFVMQATVLQLCLRGAQVATVLNVQYYSSFTKMFFSRLCVRLWRSEQQISCTAYNMHGLTMWLTSSADCKPDRQLSGCDTWSSGETHHGASVDCSTATNIADVCECFSLIVPRQQGILSQQVFVTHIIDRLHFEMLLQWCYLLEIFTTSCINAGNLRFVSSKISHS